MTRISNVEKGLRVRRGLLAVARLCHERHALLPPHTVLARALGCDPSNLSRHLDTLVENGALTVVRIGSVGRMRLAVRSIRE
jgi:DNA-binding MarR family transcriptional regulator